MCSNLFTKRSWFFLALKFVQYICVLGGLVLYGQTVSTDPILVFNSELLKTRMLYF